MYLEGSFIINLINGTIYWLLEILSFAIFGRVLLSWIAPKSKNKAALLLYRITEPVLGPIREFLQKYLNFRSRIDISPIIAILILQLLKSIVA